VPTDAWDDIYPKSGGGRADLAVEDLFTADGSGNYTSDWFLSDDLFTARVAGKFLSPSSPGITLEEGQADSSNSPRVIRSHSLTVTSGLFFQQLDLTARAFRFVISGAGNGGLVAITVRKVS
jgi:hypothetical protein